MFLKVPETMCRMDELTQEQRDDLARRINDKVLREYDDNALRAYTRAEINSSTWKKAASGDPTIARRSLTKVIRFLWPETEGDWRRLIPPLESGRPEGGDLLAEVESSNLHEAAKAEIRRLLAESAEQQPVQRRRRAT